MSMNAKDILWQKLINEEKQRLSSRPAEELISMDFFTSKIIQGGKTIIEYGIWHEVHSEDVKYSSAEEACTLSAQLDRKFGIRRPQRITHSFILKASRNVFLGLYTNYFAGFSLDDEGKVIPISDDVLYAYD